MKLSDLFDKCVKAKYIHIEENSADFASEIIGNTLYIYLQWSKGKEDWKNNFDFPAKPYRDMPVNWKAHRGFVRVWKTIEPYLKEQIQYSLIKKIIVVGYSHGAALAVLAHEYIWFNRPDIRDNCYSFAFEAPRVFCGLKIPEELKERWENLYVFRNGLDIVTHLPPSIFGFKHVGNLIKIGVERDNIKPLYWHKIKLPKFIAEHSFTNVRFSLKEYEENPFIFDIVVHNILKNMVE